MPGTGRAEWDAWPADPNSSIAFRQMRGHSSFSEQAVCQPWWLVTAQDVGEELPQRRVIFHVTHPEIAGPNTHTRKQPHHHTPDSVRLP